MINTEACIFDLDGVIVDTAKYHYLAWKRLTDGLGIEFTEHDNERLKGVSRMASLEIILELGKISASPEEKAKYATMKNRWYVEYIEKMTPEEILPGVLDFIGSLRNEGVRIGLGSASKNTPSILRRVGIGDLFDAVADGNNVSKAKPDPEVFLKAAEMLGAKPARCIVFEDAFAGIQAARNAGMMSIGIGSREILHEADMVVKGLSEMNIEKLKQFLNDIKNEKSL
jgi:beta-phosphoglucomutase